MASAQTKQYGSVKLKKGVTIKGEIIDVAYDEYVIMLLFSDTIDILWSEIDVIDMQNSSNVQIPEYNRGLYRRPVRASQPYKPKSLYMTVDMANRFGYSNWVELNPGFSLAVGYNLNSNVSVGATAGVDFYWYNYANLYPLGIEGAYRFNKKGFSPILKLRSGYTIANQRPVWWWNQDITDVKGGLFISPSIGIGGKKREHTGWYLNLSTMITNTHETGVSTIWNGQNNETIIVDRKRVITRTGLVFGLYID